MKLVNTRSYKGHAHHKYQKILYKIQEILSYNPIVALSIKPGIIHCLLSFLQHGCTTTYQVTMTVKRNHFKVLNTICQQSRAKRTSFLIIKLNSFDTQ